MKREKLTLAVVSLLMIVGSVVGLSLLIGHIQGRTIVEEVVTEEKESGYDEEGITGKPFQVLVSGADTFYNIKKKTKSNVHFRSDINLLLTVNPVSKTILITNINRDTYIKKPELSSDEYEGLSKKEIQMYKPSESTKLCLLGWWGPLPLKKGVGELLDTKVDYYIQTSMSGFSTLIDAIGGVDVDVAQSFETDWGTSYKKGMNHLDGKEALTFVRERHHLNSPEIKCGNQNDMMGGVIEKLLSKSLLEMDMDALYQLVQKNVRTNMSAGEILSLIRMQVADRAEWTVESTIIKTEGQRKKISEYEGYRFYVEVPKANSLEKTKEKIQRVLQLEK